jgi:DNA processing protein
MGDMDSVYIYLLRELLPRGSYGKTKITKLRQEAWKSLREEKILFKQAQELLDRYQDLGINVSNFFSDDYPPQLKQLSNPPMLLYYYGDIKHYHQMQNNISIVGTRHASIYGQNACKVLVANLCGFNIVSGLAYGIDSVAHQSSLETGLATAAILGCGLLQITANAHNSFLISELKANPKNLILSEFEPMHSANKWTFPLRNRIIAALSDSTVVIEAGLRSGSLITAEKALELKRGLYTMPAIWGKESFAGNQELIRQSKAKPILDPKQFATRATHQSDLSERANQILSLFGPEPQSFDYLLTKLKLNSQELLKELAILELLGFIRKTSANRYALNKIDLV